MESGQVVLSDGGEPVRETFALALGEHDREGQLPGIPQRQSLQGARDYGDARTSRRMVFAWLTRYSTRRRHSANGHLSPNEYEHRYHTAKLALAA